ncbi:G-protein coupled receptor Mth2-like [Cotesia glomerata]|uniref:G-protein coupled receptor Mth2-like n=1 Tax=Cotesia glomerata TaxID=32391 RepID=UPI001D002957|nr:G-protein coupled receptor Mth2-like [Cotesia glomerata]
MFGSRIYFIFFILIPASITSIRTDKKYCPLQEIFDTKDNSRCFILHTENFVNHYKEETKDWIDKYLMECSNDSSKIHTLTNLTILRLIACTNLVRKNDLINISYVHKYYQDDENYSTSRSMTIRKCCPQGQRYSTETRECMNFSSNYIDMFNILRDFSDKIIDSLSIIQGFPTCNYSLINHVISTIDDRLIFYNDTYQGLTFSKAGKKKLFVTENNSCFDFGSSPDTLVVITCNDAEFCEHNTCLKKCCPEDEARINNKCQKLSLFPSFKKKFHTEVESIVYNARYNSTLSDVLKFTDYSLIVGFVSCNGSKRTYPVIPSKNWYFTSSGYVYVPDHQVARHHDEYCLEMIFGNKFLEDGLYPIMCASKHIIALKNDPVRPDGPVLLDDPDDPLSSRILIKTIAETISCTFLLLTFLVYLSLPSLQNIHGITLMCYIGSLFLAFSSHTAIIFLTIYDNKTPDYYLVDLPVCKPLGYIMTASFLAAFSWLNVMCFDIWWTFRGYNGVVYINRESLGRRKRFLLYSCYAWGLPLLSSLFIFMLDSKKFIPDEWLPHLGETTCWIGAQNDNIAKVIYFYGPLTILLTINVIFFILTLRNYNRVKASIFKFLSFTSAQLDKATKTKVRLTLKLFIVMGIAWIFEVIGFFIKTYIISLDWHVIIFTVFDIINCLHGMFIFVLFVVKTDVYRALIKKFSRHRAHLRFHRRSQKTNDLRNLFKNSRSINSTSTLITSTMDQFN